MNPRTDKIEFMQIDVDYYTESAANFNRMEDGEKEDTGKPIIRLFGVNAAGNSVCAHVHNFTSYFYIHIVEKGTTLTSEEIESFRLRLNTLMHARDAVLEIEIVEKYPIVNYQKEKQQFLKVYCSHPQFVSRLRGQVEKGLRLGDKDCLSCVTFESNLPYALRFMIDNEFGGMSWVRIDAGNWSIRPQS